MTAATITPEARTVQPDAIYTVEDAARLVGYHVVTLRNKLRAGTVQGRRRRGGQWRIVGRELLKLAAAS